MASIVDIGRRFTMSFGASDTVKSFPIHENAEFNLFYMDIANFTNSVTATVSIKNVDGTTMWTDPTARTKNTKLTYLTKLVTDNITMLIAPSDTVVVTLSGAPGGAGGDVTVILRSKASTK